MVRGTRLPALGGRRGGYVVVFDEVTALIQAQRHAAWSEVARRMAHEIKNPLTPIQLSAERIRHKYLKLLPEEERATLERATHTIVEQVSALKTMVNAFADYARPAQIQSGPVNLNDLVRDVVELYIAGHDRPADLTRTDVVPLRAAEGPEGARGSRTVVLRLALDRQLPAITADAGRLRQVLHNLLINARDALVGVNRPVIRLATRSIEEAGRRYVELAIQDNGPGFPAELLPRLFEPYVTTKEKGTGLGLAIVKRIIEEHSGQIRAENLTDGGACVTLRLPLAEVVSAAPEEATTRTRRRARTERRA
jgi:nitrogen fixation/metabolism regulation signal transduction histidine kinase